MRIKAVLALLTVSAIILSSCSGVEVPTPEGLVSEDNKDSILVSKDGDFFGNKLKYIIENNEGYKYTINATRDGSDKGYVFENNRDVRGLNHRMTQTIKPLLSDDLPDNTFLYVETDTSGGITAPSGVYLISIQRLSDKAIHNILSKLDSIGVSNSLYELTYRRQEQVDAVKHTVLSGADIIDSIPRGMRVSSRMHYLDKNTKSVETVTTLK